MAANLVKVDTGAGYWRNSVSNDFSTDGYVAVPRLVVSKGLGFVTVSGTYAKLQNTDAKMYGGTVDFPIIDGGLLRPTLAVRGAYAQLSGIDDFKEKVYGAEIFLSKGFGPLTPYGAVGRMRTSADGRVTLRSTDFTLHDRSDVNRFTVGLRLSLFLPKIVVEATRSEVTSYAAKVSFGF